LFVCVTYLFYKENDCCRTDAFSSTTTNYFNNVVCLPVFVVRSIVFSSLGRRGIQKKDPQMTLATST
jgi:hypothetical protein